MVSKCAGSTWGTRDTSSISSRPTLGLGASWPAWGGGGETIATPSLDEVEKEKEEGMRGERERGRREGERERGRQRWREEEREKEEVMG